MKVEPPIEDLTQDVRIGAETFVQLPTRRCWAHSRDLKNNEVYIGRGVPQKRVPPSKWANPFRLRDQGATRDGIIEAFRDHLRAGAYLWACLPELQGKVLVCHCRPHERCHGDVLIDAVAERAQQQGHPSYLEQLATAAALELFAGQAGLTAALEEEGVKTREPLERSDEDVANGTKLNHDLSRWEVVSGILAAIWRREIFFIALETPCNTLTKLRDRPLPGNVAPRLRSPEHLLGLPKWTPGSPLGLKLSLHNKLVEHSLILFFAAKFFGGGSDLEVVHLAPSASSRPSWTTSRTSPSRTSSSARPAS